VVRDGGVELRGPSAKDVAKPMMAHPQGALLASR
jgi:hypothetical protein